MIGRNGDQAPLEGLVVEAVYGDAVAGIHPVFPVDAPGFDVARHQQFRNCYTSDAALVIVGGENGLPEKSLVDPRLHPSFPRYALREFIGVNMVGLFYGLVFFLRQQNFAFKSQVLPVVVKFLPNPFVQSARIARSFDTSGLETRIRYISVEKSTSGALFN